MYNANRPKIKHVVINFVALIICMEIISFAVATEYHFLQKRREYEERNVRKECDERVWQGFFSLWLYNSKPWYVNLISPMSLACIGLIMCFTGYNFNTQTPPRTPTRALLFFPHLRTHPYTLILARGLRKNIRSVLQMNILLEFKKRIWSGLVREMTDFWKSM